MSVRQYANQLSSFRALRLLSMDVARRILDPHLKRSYSQFGEDRLIENLLDTVKPGRFVDVGCNHPMEFSNTFRLYQKGWAGISIDANARFADMHARVRPKDVFVSALISDIDKPMVFTEFHDSLVSSVSQTHVDEWVKHRDIRRRHTMTPKTLDSVLEAQRFTKRFELLCIDAEGHDLHVLKSIDLTNYRPKLILIEMHNFEIGRANEHDIYNYLTSAGYDLVGVVFLNGFFLSRDNKQ